MKKTLSTISISAGLFATVAVAQPYTIDRYTIGGGAMNTTGGTYKLSGTIGQPDAAPTITDGNYAVDGGFWGFMAAIPSPVPKLTFSRSGNNIIICWPSPSTDFVLEQNNDLSPAGWSASGITLTDDGTIKCVTVPGGPGTKFYRLKK